MDVPISPATEEEVRSGHVGRQLREFNYGYVGEYPDVPHIRLNARDLQRQVVGGLRAVVAMYWLRVEVPWVNEVVRGNGVGSSLLAEAERMALKMGAKNAAHETFEWRGPRFYEKRGYKEVARMEKCIGNFYLALMRKQL
jgi:GNAT superfamily N-acetyltransferase